MRERLRGLTEEGSLWSAVRLGTACRRSRQRAEDGAESARSVAAGDDVCLLRPTNGLARPNAGLEICSGHRSPPRFRPLTSRACRADAAGSLGLPRGMTVAAGRPTVNCIRESDASQAVHRRLFIVGSKARSATRRHPVARQARRPPSGGNAHEDHPPSRAHRDRPTVGPGELHDARAAAPATYADPRPRRPAHGQGRFARALREPEPRRRRRVVGERPDRGRRPPAPWPAATTRRRPGYRPTRS